MGITATQVEQRKGHLGSSDIAALFGLNRFQTAYDVWLEKTGRLDGQERAKSWLDAGNEFEPIILARAEQALGPLKANQYRSAKARGLPIASHIDAIVIASGEPVEAKTNGLFWPTEEVWGTPGTSEVPDRVVIQSHVHMLCTDTDVCHVPAMFWGLRQEMYRVDRDQEVVEQIETLATDWWDRHVIQGAEPEGSIASLETVMMRRREPKKSVVISQDTATRMMLAKDMRSAADKLYDAAKAMALHEMKDAEVGTFEYDDKDMELVVQKIRRKGYSVADGEYSQATIRKAK